MGLILLVLSMMVFGVVSYCAFLEKENKNDRNIL